MLEFKNTAILIKQSSKIICLLNVLCVHIFCAYHKSLHACHANSSKHAHNFLRPVHGA